MSNTADERPAGDFDPTAGFFTVPDARPADLRPLDAARLPPYFRALLVIDGTVTKFLEAFAGEPIDVVRLDQGPGAAGPAASWLDVAVDAPVLHRSVRLAGRHSGRLFGWAESTIVPARLPVASRPALDDPAGGIGKILLDSGLETRREGLWFGIGTPASIPDAIAREARGPFVTRTYRVIAGGRALMLITERFPLPSTR